MDLIENKGVFDRHLEHCLKCQQGPASMCNAGAVLATHQQSMANPVRADGKSPMEAFMEQVKNSPIR